MSKVLSMDIRHPYVGEVPAELMQGLEVFKIDPEWQWVLVVDGDIKSQMLTVNAHGVLFILRLVSKPDAPHGWAVAFFRHVLHECYKLGMIGYMTSLSDATDGELKLMKIIQRDGGYLVPWCGVWATGRLDTKF